MDPPSPGSQREREVSMDFFFTLTPLCLVKRVPKPSASPLLRTAWSPRPPLASILTIVPSVQSGLDSGNPQSQEVDLAQSQEGQRETCCYGVSPRQGQSRGESWQRGHLKLRPSLLKQAWIICSGINCSFWGNEAETWGVGAGKWTRDSKLTKQGLIRREFAFHQEGDFLQWRSRGSTSDMRLHSHFYHVEGGRTDTGRLTTDAPEVRGHQTDKRTCLLRMIWTSPFGRKGGHQVYFPPFPGAL